MYENKETAAYYYHYPLTATTPTATCHHYHYHYHYYATTPTAIATTTTTTTTTRHHYHYHYHYPLPLPAIATTTTTTTTTRYHSHRYCHHYHYHYHHHAVKSSCELDPIPTTLVHKLSTHLTPYYKNIIDRSLISGIVPSSMKLAHVTPIIKNSSLDKSNYRPISNLSYISKTLERVVCSQLLNYLDKHKLLNKFQSAYTTHNITETALTRVQYVHILNKIRLYPTQYCSIIILLDLSAAFDTTRYHDPPTAIYRHNWYGTRTVLFLPQ